MFDSLDIDEIQRRLLNCINATYCDNKIGQYDTEWQEEKLRLKQICDLARKAQQWRINKSRAGSVTSPNKAAASAQNGRKGGRPLGDSNNAGR